jgi:ribA/ribD-fused uncharacterized protein
MIRFLDMSDNFYLGKDFDLDSTEPIDFVESRIQDLSPFSPHQVEIDDVLYATAEHAYHALRVVPEARQPIMEARSPLDSWRQAQTAKAEGNLIDGYDKDSLMEQIFRAKLEQHSDVKRVLLLTKSRKLLKVFPTDSYWGTGADGAGQNKMGKLWMKLRDELQ